MNCPFSLRKTLRLRQQQPFRFAPLTTTTIKPNPLKHDPDSDPDPDGDDSRFKGYAVGGRLFPAFGFSSLRYAANRYPGIGEKRGRYRNRHRNDASWRAWTRTIAGSHRHDGQNTSPLLPGRIGSYRGLPVSARHDGNTHQPRIDSDRCDPQGFFAPGPAQQTFTISVVDAYHCRG